MKACQAADLSANSSPLRLKNITEAKLEYSNCSIVVQRSRFFNNFTLRRRAEARHAALGSASGRPAAAAEEGTRAAAAEEGTRAAAEEEGTRTAAEERCLTQARDRYEKFQKPV